MKKFTYLCVAVVVVTCLYACTRSVYVPVEHVTTITKTEHDTVIQVHIKKETVSVATRDTIAFAETEYAKARVVWSGWQARLDLTLQNKDVKIPVETKYIETVRRDSIPYPVEVPVIEKVKFIPWYDKILRWAALLVIVASAFGFNVFDLRRLFRR